MNYQNIIHTFYNFTKKPEKIKQILIVIFVANMSIFNGTNSNLILVYETLSVEEHFETLVFDIGSLLAAAGGNLGLFLGFSCLSLLISCLDYLGIVWPRLNTSFIQGKIQ